MTISAIFNPLFLSILALFGLVYYCLKMWLRQKKTEESTVKMPDGVSRDRQAIEQPDEPGVYRCGFMLDSTEPMDRFYPEVGTLYEAFMRGLEVSDNGDCLGYRPGPNSPQYHFMSYADVFRYARDFASSLIGLMEQKPGQETLIGIYARNSPEWIIAALGSIQQSLVIVPLYDTLGADAAAYIVKQTSVQVVIVDTLAKAKSLISMKCQLPTLRHIIVVEVGTEIPADTLEKAEENDLKIHIFKEVLECGRQNPMEIHPPRPDDLYILCYTSGTTGLPKGVMLTHKNVVANLSAIAFGAAKTVPMINKPEHTLISYLPLSHMMEQMNHWFCFMTGSRIGYFRGNVQTLTDDMKALKPSIFPTVPRLLNRLYDKINQRLAEAGPIARYLFNRAYQAKLKELENGIIRNDSFWDRLVFGKLQRELGGNVRFCITGSAPISARVLETCRVALGAIILEGYGQTECTALATATWPGDCRGGHVGGPAACVLIKLEDIPDLEYYSRERRGEICIKGPAVTPGYYKEPGKTGEIIDEDGWLHTGDVGQMLPNGTIKIIDRKKHIFKLAQGEYVAPEKIENIYIRVPTIHQIFVDGNSLERYLVAVVVPDEQPLRHWYTENVLKNCHQMSNGTPANVSKDPHSNNNNYYNNNNKNSNGVSFEEMCRSSATNAYLLAEMQKLGRENKLNSIEQVKAIHVTSEQFTIENDLLTPTMKAKRPQLRKHFGHIMNKLYENGKY